MRRDKRTILIRGVQRRRERKMMKKKLRIRVEDKARVHEKGIRMGRV